jgi:hypothetical protein
MIKRANFFGKSVSVSDVVTEFLRKNRQYAFTSREIEEAVKKNHKNFKFSEFTMPNVLKWLESKKVILHKKPYWIYK